jgi:hypothetical protein
MRAPVVRRPLQLGFGDKRRTQTHVRDRDDPRGHLCQVFARVDGLIMRLYADHIGSVEREGR